MAVVLPLSLALGAGAVAAPRDDARESARATADRGGSGGKHGKHAQPELGSTVKDIIKVRGLRFKDLNDNGRLDRYEDWRLDASQRADDLVARMTLREKAGLMLIDTLNADCDQETKERGTLPVLAWDYVHSQHMHRFIFRNAVMPEDRAVCGEPGTGITATTSVTPAEAARFMNRLQKLNEGTRLGIPALSKSNARNHIDPDPRAGINEAAGAMTAFPKEAGIAAAALGEQARRTGKAPTIGDMSPVRDFARVMGKEWKAIGLRGMYGYMADLSTEPRWYRTHETFTEDADLNANIMKTLIGTLQGPVNRGGSSLSPDSPVALTMKHFPGGGPQELGLDPHYSFGKTQVYPGGGFAYHLKPFQASIDAKVSSIMPYYGVPRNVTHNGVTYDETGMAFSDQIVNGLLRDDLGFEGYVNSDTGIITSRAWGLEENTVAERIAAAVNGGTDTLSGFHSVQEIVDLVPSLVSEERVTLAAKRLLTPMFEMGLFENPYVDEDGAERAVGSKKSQRTALDVQRKSAVLLQNKDAAAGGKVLPMKRGSKVYVLGPFDPATVESYGYTVVNGNTEDPADRPSAAGSDYVLISMSARNANTSTYKSNDTATGMNPAHINPIVWPAVRGLDGKSPYGAADVCVAYDPQAECTDSTLRFGGSFPWESSILDFTGMSQSQSWEVVPSLDTVKQVMQEVGDPSKVVLQIYFRQPYVLDEASGLRDAGAIIAGFGMSNTALLDVLSGRFAPQGRMPFALAGTRKAVEEQYSDLPGYEETTDGALYPFGFGLTYR